MLPVSLSPLHDGGTCPARDARPSLLAGVPHARVCGANRALTSMERGVLPAVAVAVVVGRPPPRSHLCRPHLQG